MAKSSDQIIPFPVRDGVAITSSQLFEGLEIVELERRVELLNNTKGYNLVRNTEQAKTWLESEKGRGQLSLPIDKYTYRIHYLRKNESIHYNEVCAEIDCEIYDWPVTKKWLTAIIQEQFDARCECVVTFYEITEALELPLDVKKNVEDRA